MVIGVVVNIEKEVLELRIGRFGKVLPVTEITPIDFNRVDSSNTN